MQDELVELRTKQRPKIVQDVADAAAQAIAARTRVQVRQQKLREIDRRIHYLTKRLETGTVVGPLDREGAELDRVFFGAVVDVEDGDGKASTYEIVGADEIDLARGRISYRCHSARAAQAQGRRDRRVPEAQRRSGAHDRAIRYEE